MYDIYPVLYTTKDIKNIFKCGQRQAYELMHTNGFPSIKINNKLLVEKKALEKWFIKNEGKHILVA